MRVVIKPSLQPNFAFETRWELCSASSSPVWEEHLSYDRVNLEQLSFFLLQKESKSIIFFVRFTLLVFYLITVLLRVAVTDLVECVGISPTTLSNGTLSRTESLA